MEWYEVVRESPQLEQGDLLPAVPVPTVIELPNPQELGRNPDRPILQPEYMGLVVLTQSCDIDHESTTNLLLARFVSWPLASQQRDEKTGATYRKRLRNGQILHQALLPPRLEPPSQDWALVDFKHLVLLDREYLCEHAAMQALRLRTRPPLREGIVNAFCRWLSRPDYFEEFNEFDSWNSPDA